VQTGVSAQLHRCIYRLRPSRYLHDRAGWDGVVNAETNLNANILLTGEQTVNSFLGGTQVPALNAGVFLTGGGSGVFNTNGGIGGLEGIFDQSLAAYADLAGFH
jgi:hypothetical protein